jgi:hypothetical protein
VSNGVERWTPLVGLDVLATSGCNAANLVPVPILPAKTLEISLGGLTVLLTGGAGYQRSRRRKVGKAARPGD